MGISHLSIVNAQRDASVVAVCDTSSYVLSVLRKYIGVETFDRYEDMIDRGALDAVVVGAGPTGVEIAGQIAELARDTLRRDFRSVDPRAAGILLVEAGDRLTGVAASLSGEWRPSGALPGRCVERVTTWEPPDDGLLGRAPDDDRCEVLPPVDGEA